MSILGFFFRLSSNIDSILIITAALCRLKFLNALAKGLANIRQFTRAKNNKANN